MLREDIAKNVVVIISYSARKSYTLRPSSGNNVYTDVFDATDDMLLPDIHLITKSLLALPITVCYQRLNVKIRIQDFKSPT
jgi:hypothetical protein